MADVTTDPIAIVGMGCRYPGNLCSPGELWDFVSQGCDAAVPEFPADREWDLAALTNRDTRMSGSTYVRGGSFVAGVGEFDPSFFGISPREALAMDPQQRILLEVSWEALEHAGIDPTTLSGTSAGVYFGVASQEYGPRLHSGAADYPGHLATGTALSVASGRVSYVLGLEGPAVTVDTACSSSLVAIHLAVRGLRAGECSIALAGGACVNCAPGLFIALGDLGALAPNGISKPFSADADGFGVAEGAGVLVLERLSDARRYGHTVLAVLRGTAIGQDGASDNLVSPSEAGQRRVILDALADAGLSPAEVDVVEAHGTGTKVGDPMEASALVQTYGAARSAVNPLLVGSIKSNIGHPQAASGVAGVIKMVEAIRHAEVPGTLHLSRLTDAVDWSSGTVQVVADTMPWPATQRRPRRAAVSSFGISGTNAHIIVEQAPPEQARQEQAPDQHDVPFVLSAKTEVALRAQAARLHAHLSKRSALGLVDVAHTLAAGRVHFDHRAVLVARDRAEVLAGLAALAENRPDVGMVTGKANRDTGVVFVFPGQGPQWTEMAVELLDSSKVFAAQIDACDRAFAEFVDWSLLDVLNGKPDAPGLNRVDVVQPALFAVMVSLARCWQALGIQPTAVIGHSQGEIAAAYVAGALSLQDAAKIVTLRSKAIVAIAGTGGMVSVSLAAAVVAQHLRGWAGRLEIATINGPRAAVVSGDITAIEEFVSYCEANEIETRRLPVDYASHSSHVDVLDETLHQVIADVRPVSAEFDFISTVTGKLTEGTDLGADYWYRNLRQTVNFEQAIHTAHDQGHRIFIEVSPHPVLTVGVEESLAEDGSNDPSVVVGSLRRDDGSLRRLLTSVAEVHVTGKAVDLSGYLEDHQPRLVALPTYAFQRKRFWLPLGPAARSRDVTGGSEHPFLTAVHDHPEHEGLQFTGRLSLANHPWLADHAVNKVIVLPGAAIAEFALFVGQQVGCPLVSELVLHEPLVIPKHGAAAVQVVVSDEAAGGQGMRIYSRTESDELLGAPAPWTKNAEAVLAPDPGVSQDTNAGLAVWPPPGAERIDVSDVYERMVDRGYQFGPAFRGLRRAWRRGSEFYSEVELREEVSGVRSDDFGLHPALLDSALHVFGYVDPDREKPADEVRLPYAWEGIRLSAVGASVLRVRVSAIGPDAYQVTLADPDGQTVCAIESLTTRPTTIDRLRATGTAVHDALFSLDWKSITVPTGPRPQWAQWPEVAAGVAVLRCADESGITDLPQRSRQALEEILGIAQQWLTDPRCDNATLVVVTKRAVSTHDGEDVVDMAYAPVWGLLRSAQTENPGRLVLVDVDDWSAWRDLVATGLASGEPQVAFRGGVACAPRVVRAGVTPAGRPERRWKPGTVLITGGTGGLGAILARHLVTTHGVQHLLLVSRSGSEAANARELGDDLRALGANVRIAACDVADRQSLDGVLAQVPAAHPLTAVIHAAGVLDDASFTTMSVAQLDRVLRAKLDAAWNLHQATERLDLSAFVIFSSVCGILGAAGQASYAAANTFLDALAGYRRHRGLSVTCLGWGKWALRTGMTRQLTAQDDARTRQVGLGAISAEEGLTLFDVALRRDESLLIPARFDVTAAHAHWPSAFSTFARPGLRTASNGRGEAEARQVSDDLAGMPAVERRAAVLKLILGAAATVLNYATPETIDPDRDFKDMGFDSLGFADFRNRLKKTTGLSISVTAVFDHQTPDALAEHLLTLVATGTDDEEMA